MILVRLLRSSGPDRAVGGIDPAELRARLVELRTTRPGQRRRLRQDPAGARQLARGRGPR